jgi:hypothetical protein
MKLTTDTNKTRSHNNLNIRIKDEGRRSYLWCFYTQPERQIYKVETNYWIDIYMRFHCTEKQLESTAANPSVDTQSSLRMLIEVAHELIEFFDFRFEHSQFVVQLTDRLAQRWLDNEGFQHRGLLTGTNEQGQIICRLALAEEWFLFRTELVIGNASIGLLPLQRE